MTRWWLVPLDIPIDIDGDEGRRRAVEELAKAKYGGIPPWVGDLLERVANVLTRVAEFFAALLNPGGAAGTGVNPGFVLAVIVLVLAIGFVVYRVGLPRWQERRADANLDLDSTVPPADYRARAEEHANRGDWPAAVRDRFRALIRELEVRTIIDVRPARTATEAAWATVQVMPQANDDMQQGADLFNQVMYSDQPTEREAYLQLIAIDARVTYSADEVDLAQPAGVGPR